MWLLLLLLLTIELLSLVVFDIESMLVLPLPPCYIYICGHN